jgi:hypothetical protein
MAVEDDTEANGTLDLAKMSEGRWRG